ncbi:MAG: hypothetical protein Q9195_008517 [Heterodermia aff. obscurata]
MELSNFSECQHCEFLRRRVGRRDATLAQRIADDNEMIRVLSDTGAAGYHSLALANAEIRRLGGTEVEMTAAEEDVEIWVPVMAKPANAQPAAAEAGQAEQAPAEGAPAGGNEA